MQEDKELEQNAVSENRLAVMPVGKLLVYMSVPTMFSMLIQALYNVVDSIFVARFSEGALTAVSLVFPLQMLMFSFAVGTNVGICSVIARRLGARREDDAAKAARTGYLIDLVFCAVFVLIGLFLAKPFVKLYTSSGDLIDMAVTYARICLGIPFGVFLGIFSEKTIQGTGDTIHPMIIQASGAIINIILDPILIFGYLGLPGMGVKGAAIATVLGQLFAMVLGLFFLKRNKYLRFSLMRPVMDRESAADILKVGMPAVVMQGIGTVMMSFMNAILITFDVLATAAFGLYFKLQSFVFMPVFGLNSGLMPIIGFNYGARNKARMMKALKLGLIYAFLIMSLGCLLFNIFPKVLLDLFNASESLAAIGVVALRVISYSFPLASVSIIMSSLFQAKGDGYLSMIISIVRQLFFLIPCAWLLGRLSGLDAVWYSFLIAEVFAMILSIIFYRREMKTIDF